MADTTVEIGFQGKDENVGRTIDGISGKLKQLAGFAIAAFSVKALIDFGAESIKIAQQAELINNQLLVSVKNMKQWNGDLEGNAKAIKETTAELKAYSTAMQIRSTFDDDAILQAETKLIHAGLEKDAIKTLIPAIMDKVAATEELENQDMALVTASEQLNRALNGNTGALSRMGIFLSEAETKQFELMTTQERAGFVAEKMSEKYKGAAEDMLGTSAGATKAMAVQWENFQEELGTILLPIVNSLIQFGMDTIKAIQEFMATLKVLWEQDWGHIRTTVENVQKWIQNEFLPAWQAWIADVETTFAPITDFFKAHWLEIQIIFDTAFAALRLAWEVFWLAIKLIFETAWQVIKGVITAALAILKGDWKGAWEAIQGIFTGIWNSMQSYVQGVLNSIITFLSNSWASVKTQMDEAWVKIKAAWDNFWNGMKQTVDSIINGIIGAIDRLIKKITSAINSLGNLAKAYAAGVVSRATSGYVTPGAVKAKAHGGSVISGEDYLVGEKGPELFTPRMNGRIIPNHKLGGGKAIVINFNGLVSSKEVALEYADIVIRELKLSNAIV